MEQHDGALLADLGGTVVRPRCDEGEVILYVEGAVVLVLLGSPLKGWGRDNDVLTRGQGGKDYIQEWHALRLSLSS